MRYWQWNRGKPNYTHNAALREGAWKLVRPYVTRQANPKDSQRKPALYNLTKDPIEQNDLARQDPERTARMERLLTTRSRSVEESRMKEDAVKPK